MGGRSVGHQVLYALSLCSEKYRIVACDAAPFSFGLYRADASWLVPPARSEEYLPAIRRLVEKEQIEIVLPGTQPEVLVLAGNRDSLGSAVSVIVNPTDVVQLCQNKKTLYAWLEREGVVVPPTVSGENWRELVRAVGFPIVGKPILDTGGSRDVAILISEEEVMDYLRLQPTDQVVFQQYVGSPEEEYTVGVLMSREGAVIDSDCLAPRADGTLSRNASPDWRSLLRPFDGILPGHYRKAQGNPIGLRGARAPPAVRGAAQHPAADS